jgi:hypothetical protein
MAKQEMLPKRLKYLQPFREFLNELPKAEVGEATDTTLLEKVLRKRIRGKSVKGAQEHLNEDIKELENYLTGPRHENDRLHFVLGFLLIAAEKPKKLLNPPEKRKLILERLKMNLPPKAKPSVDEYSLTVKWKRQHFYALRCDMSDDFSREYTLAQLANPNASEYELLNLVGAGGIAESVPPAARPIRPTAIPVNLGKVVGHKVLAIVESPVASKHVSYLLKIPKGYVNVSISARESFDESEWETYLATLRFEIPAP